MALNPKFKSTPNHNALVTHQEDIQTMTLQTSKSFIKVMYKKKFIKMESNIQFNSFIYSSMLGKSPKPHQMNTSIIQSILQHTI